MPPTPLPQLVSYGTGDRLGASLRNKARSPIAACFGVCLGPCRGVGTLLPWHPADRRGAPFPAPHRSLVPGHSEGTSHLSALATRLHHGPRAPIHGAAPGKCPPPGSLWGQGQMYAASVVTSHSAMGLAQCKYWGSLIPLIQPRLWLRPGFHARSQLGSPSRLGRAVSWEGSSSQSRGQDDCKPPVTGVRGPGGLGTGWWGCPPGREWDLPGFSSCSSAWSPRTVRSSAALPGEPLVLQPAGTEPVGRARSRGQTAAERGKVSAVCRILPALITRGWRAAARKGGGHVGLNHSSPVTP